jgi:hypothetical protein
MIAKEIVAELKKLGSTYPQVETDYRVRGVSWYEAAAYAKFAGSDLPPDFVAAPRPRFNRFPARNRLHARAALMRPSTRTL